MKKHSIICAAVIAATTLGSCSLFNKRTAATPVNSKETSSQQIPVTVYSDASIEGHWFIRTVGSIKLTGYDEECPFLEFVPTENRFYGNNGCNIINGAYRTDGNQSLELLNVASTMRLCPADTLQYPIAKALEAVRSFSVTTASDGSTILRLHNDKNTAVMTLSKSDIDFLNGAWRVASINGREVNNHSCRLIFDVSEGTVSGDTGCNILNGQLTREPSVSGSLGFSHIATTRRACPDLSTEQALMIALEEVTFARHAGGTAVNLLNSSGKVVLHLTRMSKSEFSGN